MKTDVSYMVSSIWPVMPETKEKKNSQIRFKSQITSSIKSQNTQRNEIQVNMVGKDAAEWWLYSIIILRQGRVGSQLFVHLILAGLLFPADHTVTRTRVQVLPKVRHATSGPFPGSKTHGLHRNA
jgi:hypothetical protein